MAIYDLHLTEGQFWRLSPREYKALVDRKIEAGKQDDARMGHLLTMIAPFLGVKKSNGLAMTMGDFFPSLAPHVGQSPSTADLRLVPRPDEDAFTKGWDSWAKISRAVAKHKRVGV